MKKFFKHKDFKDSIFLLCTFLACLGCTLIITRVIIRPLVMIKTHNTEVVKDLQCIPTDGKNPAVCREYIIMYGDWKTKTN